MTKNITITGPRSVGKTTASKVLAKKLKLKYISSDEVGEKALKNKGGLDKVIKSGSIKEFIKKSGYSLIKKQFNKDNFVFDLSIGSFTSRDFKKASREVRSIAKKKSIVVVLLPYRNQKDSIEFLYKREIKRKHFKEIDKEKLFKRTKRRYPEQLKILNKNCNFIIYVGNKRSENIVKEIMDNLK